MAVFSVSIAHAQKSTSYHARIQCPHLKIITQDDYTFATSDLEAENEFKRRLRDDSSYRGKSCQIIEIIKGR